MKDRTDPRALDLPALCRAGETLSGEWPPSAMPRLLEGTAGAADDDTSPIGWSAAGELRPVAGGDDEFWLRLQASTTVTLQCQRCLQPMTEPLAVDRRLRFVRGEAEAARLDEVSDDDVLDLPPRLDLRALVEDELILALPIVPRHDVCPDPLPLPDDAGVDGPGDDGTTSERANPFAALAALRRGSGGGSGNGSGSGSDGAGGGDPAAH